MIKFSSMIIIVNVLQDTKKHKNPLYRFTLSGSHGIISPDIIPVPSKASAHPKANFVRFAQSAIPCPQAPMV
jgi:hypothetical protein